MCVCVCVCVWGGGGGGGIDVGWQDPVDDDALQLNQQVQAVRQYD